MTAEPDLLPLPERFSFMEWETHMRDYARACVSSATEALRAEVERLEDESQSRLEACGDAVSKLCAAEARAERLAEALREAADMLLADYPKTAKRLRAALHPTAAQEGNGDE